MLQKFLEWKCDDNFLYVPAKYQWKHPLSYKWVMHTAYNIEPIYVMRGKEKTKDKKKVVWFVNYILIWWLHG